MRNQFVKHLYVHAVRVKLREQVQQQLLILLKRLYLLKICCFSYFRLSNLNFLEKELFIRVGKSYL